jgi:Fur family transcriptional regulator, ferric uptake regulator
MSATPSGAAARTVARDGTHQSSADQARRMLRGRGLRSTPQRVAVIGVLVEAAETRESDGSSHLTVPEIHDRLRDRGAHIDQSTIYRTVATLAEESVLHSIAYVDRPTSYGLVGVAHHHAVCTGCGTVLEIAPEEIARALDELVGATGFAPADLRVTVHGTCRSCAAAGVSAPHPH